MNTNTFSSYLESHTCYMFTLLCKLVLYEVSVCMNVCCKWEHLSAFKTFYSFHKSGI